jgi:hypothetical protein
MADDSQFPVLQGAEEVSGTRQRRESKARLGFLLFLFSVVLIVSGEVWGASVAARLAGSSGPKRLESIKYGYGGGLVGALFGGALFAAIALRSHVRVSKYAIYEVEDPIRLLAGFFVRRDVACFCVLAVAIAGAVAGSILPDIQDRELGRKSFEEYRLLGAAIGVAVTGLVAWILFLRWRALDCS